MTPSSPPIASGDACRRVAFPTERRLVLDTLRLGRGRHMMHALLEVDVTRARALLREHRERTGTTFSFTAFVLASLGRAVAAHPEVHALRDWAGRLVLFEDVDVAIIVEVDVEGRPFGLAHVVRATNRRSLLEIHEEIRRVQTKGMDSLESRTARAARIGLLAPGFARRLALRLLLRSPRAFKREVGTVLLSSIGMFAGGIGWGLTAPGIHGLSVMVGGIGAREGGEGDRAPRELLCLTVSADHDLVDGAPVARFVRDLRERIESADGLADALGAPSPEGEE